MATRSRMLAADFTTTLTTWIALATVPAGEVWIIKSIALHNNSVNASKAKCRISVPSLGFAIQFLDEPIAADDVFYWEGWTVAEAGSVLQIWTDQSALISHWSGALLSA